VDENTSYAQVVEEWQQKIGGQNHLQARYVWGDGLAPLAQWRRQDNGSYKLFFYLSDGQDRYGNSRMHRVL
jgi:hypothetical protein